MSFFLYKIREQEGRRGPVWGIGTSGGGEYVGKGHGRVTVVQIWYIRVCKWKNDTCLKLFWEWREGDKGE
jgi:hypothetical protein